MNVKRKWDQTGFLIIYLVLISAGILGQEINTLLPTGKESSPWEMKSSPETYLGEDLFLFINGGAEIYHEYGFVAAMAAVFKAKTGNTINLEIYKMVDASSAFGIFSYKTGVTGMPLPIGNEARLEDYYLNVWKGKFCITLIGMDTKQITQKGLVQLARIIVKKIGENGRHPDLIKLIEQTEPKPKSSTYIRGNLGLFNTYAFSTENIFKVREGVIGHYPDYRVMIFRYPNSDQTRTIFDQSSTTLAQEKRFTGHRREGSAYFMQDKKGADIGVYFLGRHICIIIGADRKTRHTVLTRMDRALRTVEKP